MKSCLNRKNFIVVGVLTALLGLFAEAGGAEPNLVSWWKLDEGTGSTAYDSAGGNHGTIYGAQWSAGQIGGALSFDGADDYIDCGNDNSLAITDNLTIAAWVKRESTAGSSKEVIVSKYDGGQYSYRLFFLGGGRVRWYLSSDGGTSSREYVNSTLQITDTNWHFIAATFESGILKIYIDGADRSGTKKGNISSIFASTEPLFIGQENSGGYFNGLIDEVKIFDRALSSEEILQLYEEELLGGRAFNPKPADGASFVDPNVVLRWTPGTHATSHDVYFGPDFGDVNDADTSSPEYMGNQYDNSFSPSGLEKDTTYYWRIDEVNGLDTRRGDVWSFTTWALVSWWRFDEGSGTTAYDSAGDNDGTLINGPVWTTGQVGGALEFDGTDDFVNISDPASFNFETDFTWAAWIKTDAGGVIIARTRGEDDKGPKTFFVRGGMLAFDVGWVGVFNQSRLVNDNEWHHVVVTVEFDGFDTIQYYVDGGLDAQGQMNVDAFPDEFPLWIGFDGRAEPGEFPGFSGIIDGVRIYDRALSAEEILQLYQEGLGSNVWVQTNGPAGGIINTIEIDPDNPETVYAGGIGGGVFKSTDGGDTWPMLERIVEPSEHIMDILLKPGEPQTIYAQTHRLYKSTNGGVSWHLTENFGGVRCSAISPGVLLAGRWDGRVYRSTNDGASWTNITGNLPGVPFADIADIAIGASNEYWAGTADGSDGRLYHTTNGGAYWSEISIDKPPDTDIRSIFVDPEDSDTVYVGLGDVHNEWFHPYEKYLFKTTNGGTTWSELYLPHPHGPRVGPSISILGKDITNGWLYVGNGTQGVCKSNNGGQTWTDISPYPINTPEDIAINPDDVDILFLPTPRNGGIYKSTNGGGSWTRINEGLRNTAIALLAVPNVPGNGTVYASARSGEGAFKTTDYGNTWTNITGGGIDHPYADEIVVSPHDPETVWYVADVPKVFRTTNSGATWNMIINPWQEDSHGFRFGSVHAVTPAPSDKRIIYAVKSGYGIFKSDNFGNSWRFLHQSEIDYTYSIAVHPTNPDIVYSGYNPKPFQDFAMVRKTSDGGDSWVTSLNVPKSNGITSVVIDPTNPDTIYAGSIGQGGQIYKSTNGGNSWSKLNQNFIMCTVWGQPQLIINPDNPLIAYTGTWLAGTWKTTNAGQSWTLLENAPVSATSLSMDASDTDVIYLSDRTSPKLWKTTDAGSTWQVTADFSSDRAFLVNRVFADGHTVYAA
ncbi:MAG: LamG-like jellyroll fold domain-containing protein, partial [Planctomycetota bacterium]